MLTPTGITSANYWSAIKTGNHTHIRMTFTGQNIVLDDSDIAINGIAIHDMFNGETDLVFGKAVCKQFTANILNSSKLNGLVWTGEFTLEMGVEVGNPATTYWVQLGIFSGEKPNNVTTVDVIQFTAYDRMTQFDVLADKFLDSLTYPKTVKNIYDLLCAYIGLSNVAGDELANIMDRSYSVLPVDMSGYTCRDILALIAEACGCYAKIDNQGRVVMRWFTNNTSHAITGDEEFSIESGDINDGLTWDEADTYTWNEIDNLTWDDICGYQEAYSIDMIQVRQSGNDLDVNYPAYYGGNMYVIVDNPFLFTSTAAEITNYIKPLYDRMVAFGGYLPVNISCVGCWLVEAGDIITATVKTNTITVPIFVKSMTWNGAINDSYETTGNKQRTVYSSNADREKVINSKYIRMFVEDNFYQRRSGIEINNDGVEIYGNKYVLIETSSIYKWTYDRMGISLGIDDDYYKMKFFIGEHPENNTYNERNGIAIFDSDDGDGNTYHNIQLISRMDWLESGEFVSRLIGVTLGMGLGYRSGLSVSCLRSRANGLDYLGSDDHHWGGLFVNRIYGFHPSSGNVSGRLTLYPSTNNLNNRLNILDTNNQLVLSQGGTSTYKLLFEGSITGGSYGTTLPNDLTDMNALTEPGHYWGNIQGNSNVPSNISFGQCEVIVTKSPYTNQGYDYVHQVIINYDCTMYVRSGLVTGSWNSWKKITMT